MLKSRAKRGLLSVTILSLLIAMALPTVAFGQGRSRGHERRYERRDDSRFGNRRDKRKHGKFINGHDARDGRWDGRGPRRKRHYDRNDHYRNRNRSRRSSNNGYYRDNRRYDDDYYDRDSNSGAGGILNGILGGILGGQ